MTIFLPPLTEQRRIVTKVDQLMALCDHLEAKQKQEAETHTRAIRAAYHPLTKPKDQAGFQAAWQRIRHNFDTLHTNIASAKVLRETILQLAVQGKLVPQDPNDEPASVLLERIRVEKEWLVSEGKIDKVKPSPPVRADEVPFVLPSEWQWARGGHLFTYVTSGSRGWAQYYADSGAIFLRIGNLDYGTTSLDLRKIQHVIPPAGAEGTRTKVQPNDILISITGDTGMVGLAPPGIGDAYINQHIALAHPAKALLPKYLAVYLTSQMARNQLQRAQRGIKNSLGLDDIRRLLVPLPPIDEQSAIVQRLNQLMALCDELESNLQAHDKTAEHFAEAMVAELAA